MVFNNNSTQLCVLNNKKSKSVLDKIGLENRTITQITSKERIDQRLWNPVALREAIINGIINIYLRSTCFKSFYCNEMFFTASVIKKLNSININNFTSNRLIFNTFTTV